MTAAGRFLLNDSEYGALPTLYAATQDIPGGSYVGPHGLGGIEDYPALGWPHSAAPAQPRRATAGSLTGHPPEKPHGHHTVH
jgi:hypothetical protein